MASYPGLGTIGQEYILEEQYKALFGYPNGNVNNSLAQEVPGTSRPFILQNQIYSQEIPISAPSVFGETGTTSIGGVDVTYQNPTSYPYLTKYYKVPLSNEFLSLSSNATGNGALTWWFKGANVTNPADQVINNILNRGVPNNLDPDNGYIPTLYISNTPYGFGNAQYPWTYNVNSGIVLFTGSSSSGTSNKTPLRTDDITFTFWRYDGTIGVQSGSTASTFWEATGTTGIQYGALSVASDSTNAGSIYTQNIQAKYNTSNVNLYTNLTGGLTIGTSTTTTFNGTLDIGSYNNFVNNRWIMKFFDVNSPFTNFTQLYMHNGNEFVIGPDTIGDKVSVYIKESSVTQIQRLEISLDKTKITNTLEVGTTGGSAALFKTGIILNDLTSPYSNFFQFYPNGNGMTYQYNGVLQATFHNFTACNNANLNRNTFKIGYDDVEIIDGINLKARLIKSTATASASHTLFDNMTSGSVLTIGHTASSNTINGSSNFTSTLLSRSNLKLYEWGLRDANTITLTFPMERTIGLRVVSGSSMTLNLPLATANERGMIFTFIKFNSNFSVTINTTGGQAIYPLNNLTGNPTTNTTLLSTDRLMTKLAVGYYAATTYWIEVSDYSTFDIDYNNTIYPRLSIANTFTNTNTFNQTLNAKSDIVCFDKTSPNTNTLTINQNSSNANYVTTAGTTTATSHNFYTQNSQGTTANTLKIEYDTSTFNSALVVGGTATFNGQVNATNKLVVGVNGNTGLNLEVLQQLKLYDVNSPFTDYGRILNVGGGIMRYHSYSQIQGYSSKHDFYSSLNGVDDDTNRVVSFETGASATKVFNNLYSSNLQGLTATGTQNLYTNLQTNGSLNIGSNASTCNINSNTTFSQIPVCSVGATSSNQLVNYTTLTGQNYTTKSYVDSKTYQVLNFSPTEVSNIKKSIIYRNAATITASSITAYLDNAPTTQQIYTFGKKINNLWVAMGTSGGEVNSSNGINWVTNNTGTSVLTVLDSVFCITYSRGRWVAGGASYGGTIAYSSAYSNSGTTWNNGASNSLMNPMNDVATNGTIWVAVGQGNNKIIYSAEGGQSWSTAGANSIFTTAAYGIASSRTRWVAVGQGGNTIAYSNSGTSNWTAATNIFSGGQGNGVAWNGSVWVAVGKGSGHEICYSADGITWTANGEPFSSGVGGFCVAWNGKMWVAGGGGNNNNAIIYSYDGKTWTSALSSMFGGGNNTKYVKSIKWSGSMWVAVGNTNDNSISNIAYSQDGVGWSSASSSNTATILFNGVAFNSGYGGNKITFNNTGITGTISITNSSISLSSGDQLDVVCDSTYDTGFTNCSISIDN